MSKVYILSSQPTCKSQSVLSSRLVAYCVENRHELTKDIRNADILLINTCGFTIPNQKDSETAIRKAFKECSPSAKVCAIGCLVKIDKDGLKKKFRELNLIDEPAQVDALLKTERSFKENKNFHYDNSLFKKIAILQQWIIFKNRVFANILKGLHPAGPFLRLANERSDQDKLFVEISSGCLNQCSYCVIKKARGVAVSRPVEDIMAELKATYRKGLSLNLVADDCGSYGYEKGTDLLALLYSIDREYPGISLELSYLHPRWLIQQEEGYLQAFKRLNVASMNVSLQSGSDKVLDAMKRGYKSEEVLRILSKIKSISPSTLIWGNFIYGHPVERWKDFKLTLKALKHYDSFCWFRFSPVGADAVYVGEKDDALGNCLKSGILETWSYIKILGL